MHIESLSKRITEEEVKDIKRKVFLKLKRIRDCARYLDGQGFNPNVCSSVVNASDEAVYRTAEESVENILHSCP